MTDMFYMRTTEAERLPPPRRTTGVVAWLQANLFSSISNTIFTVVAALFILWLVPLVYNFLIGRAVFSHTAGAW